MLNFGLDIAPTPTHPTTSSNSGTPSLGFRYGSSCFGPVPEVRRLDAIRPSLRNPQCNGPQEVYAIAMDVGRHEDKQDLLRRNLLFGVVTYASGRLGDEPIRSQGHVHAVSASCGWSTPEVYEIWQGRAVILMQEYAEDNPGRCFAVEAGPGEVVVVPPKWAHATLSANPTEPLTFGAWCVRDYGFDYTGVRAHGGLAWFPLLDAQGQLHWQPNPRYHAPHYPLTRKPPRIYDDLQIDSRMPIYLQYRSHRTRFDFVPRPQQVESLWQRFVP